MISKKDIELIASVVRKKKQGIDPHAYYGDVNIPLKSLELSVEIMCEALGASNPRFQHDRFKKACGF